jgi:diguanylate cyclase (GGDEF)-like protein/PAS domain S-box-containing protein
MTEAPTDLDIDMGEEPHPDQGWARLRLRARWETALLSLAAVVVVLTAVLGVSFSATRSVRSNFENHLEGLAREAAQLVDPAAQLALRDPRALNGPQYLQAVAALRRFKAALPEVRYAYTVSRDGDQVRFVLDAAAPGARNAQGVPEQSGVWELYAGDDGAMRAALGMEGRVPRAGVTEQPYTDAWGTFMTGWSPIYDAQQREVGAVGVDVDASVYLQRLGDVRLWALLGMLPALLLIAALGFAFYRMRVNAHSAAVETMQAAEIAEWSARRLGEERQRLANLLEATNVGTWSIDLQRGTVSYDERCADLLGQGQEPRDDLPLGDWIACIHEQDRDAVATAISEARVHPEAHVLREFRMQHADGRWIWLLTRGRVLEQDDAGRGLRLGGIQVDISARKVAELAMADSETQLRALFELSPVGIALEDLESGRFLQVNDSLLEPTGYTREEMLALTYWDVTPAHFEASQRAQLEALRRTNRYGPFEKEFLRKDGTPFPVLLSGVRMVDKDGREMIWTIIQDISRRKAMETALEQAARRDKLTGLANRAWFMERLQQAVARVRAGRQEHIALLYLDFDRFKVVNDTLGHGAGDELLRQISARLTQALRSGLARGGEDVANVVGRFGGDEFLVLINDLAERKAVTRIAERLLNALSPVYNLFGNEVFSTASIGIACADTGNESADDLVRNADLAMYEAKHAGRACSVEFSEEMHTRLMRHVTIETALRRAIGTSELSLVYQPIVALDTGHMASAEALVRWQHPDMGAVTPSEFIPIAEDSGLVVALGQWVLNEACAQLAQWRGVDPARAPGYVSVNISRAELALGGRLLDRIRSTLDRHGLPAECLQLEVTEREVMRNPAEALALMKSLQALGVRLAMDDFGTGTSSLAFLRDYPFNTIKIDRTFVKDLEASTDVLAVIHATITLVENLGMASVAEGVESPGQLAVLQSLGCRYAQGYYFSRPVVPGKLLDALAAQAEARPARTPVALLGQTA